MIDKTVDGRMTINGTTVSGSVNIVRDGEIGIVTRVREPLPVYDGATTITPSSSMQVLATSQKTLLTDIVINPVPSNYGLVTWDGSTLTVS